MTDEPRAMAPPKGGGRIPALDIARGAALLAMALYHLTWDLDFFGYVARGLASQGGWRLFARCIASSFLFLVGVGLVLAHLEAIRWRPFLVRLAQVAAGAAAITLVTVFITPDSFVFFGILHHIALASVVGLLFLRLPPTLTVIAAALVIALPLGFETSLTQPKALAWLGFAAKPTVSNDFVPMFPWFGAVLLGIAAARLALDAGLVDRLRRAHPGLARLGPLAWLGRHSLGFYLLHQPLLYGLVFLASQAVPPDRAAILEADCRQACLAERDAEACRRYCACARGEVEKADLLRKLLDGTTSVEEDARVREIVGMCSARP